MTSFRLAQAQIAVHTDGQALSDCIRRAAEEAAQRGADLLALPEMFCCPYDVSSFLQYAQEEGGPVWQLCSDAARDCGICLSAGTMPEKGEDGRIYNTAYVFGKDGTQIAKHRKMHLFDISVKGGQHFRESAVLSPGNSVTTFHTEFGTMGLAVCYDIRFPELFRLMALKGAELILVPASFNMTTGPMHWELLFRSQAVYNQVFIAGTAPARCKDSSYVSWAHSIVTDPWGNILSEMDEKEGICITEIDLSKCTDAREQIPVLKHRREDIYIVKERRE